MPPSLSCAPVGALSGAPGFSSANAVAPASASAIATRAENPSRRIRYADDHRHGAVVHGLGVGHAPVDVVEDTHAIAGPLALVEVAQAACAGGLAAAIVVADQVVLAVLGALACANPA